MMTGKDYTKLAMRTNDEKGSERLLKSMFSRELDIGGIIDGCLGLAGESGEFNDIVKKWIFHEKPLDEEHAKKELGDVMWYVAMLCYSFGWDLDEIMEMNINKLRERYPNGFNVDNANNRNESDI